MRAEPQILSFLSAVCFCAAAYADKADDFSSISLEELSGIKVFSASKKSEDPQVAPSSAYIITAEDMRQMGVTHIADALRVVPGLHVAQLSASKWMVSARGFGEQFTNKLLVLIDGRPVYSTMFSGVFWDEQDLILDDIAQIEVIRGPGATLWGANAVNGVINIITRHAKETQGQYMSLTYGNQEAIAEIRDGRQITKNGFLRTGFKLRSHDGLKRMTTGDANQDEWKSGLASFRYDKQQSYNRSWKLYGNAARGIEDADYNLPSLSAPYSTPYATTETYESVVLGGERQYGVSPDSDYNVQAFLQYDQRDVKYAQYNVYTFGLNAQNDLKFSDTHQLIWGAGYTFVSDEIDNTLYLSYSPDERDTHFFNFFVEDKIALLPEHDVYLTTGSKLEHNGYSGFELLPSAKLSWQLNKSDLLWSSVSRAVRTPSRGTHDLSLVGLGTPHGYIGRLGDPGFRSEELIAYETGYKTNITDKLYVDLTAFYNDYDSLRTFEASPSSGMFFVPLRISNLGEAQNYGFEAAIDYRASRDLRFWLSYSYIHMKLDLDGNSQDQVFYNDEGKTPQQQVSLRTQYHLTDRLSFNNTFHYVDELPSLHISDYLKWDSNLVWSAQDNLRITLAGENLADAAHSEFSEPLYGDVAEVSRAFYVRLELDL